MGRPRTFSADAVIDAAMDAFWAGGYAGVSTTDLETITGLSRSSLYQAFGNKSTLFTQALDAYIRGFIGPLLAPMERDGATARDVEAFFRRMGSFSRRNARPHRRGCLWLNAIVQLAEGNGDIDVRGAEYARRLTGAFGHALRADADAALAGRRARLLTSATWGIWLMLRADPSRSRLVCDAIESQVRAWGERA